MPRPAAPRPSMRSPPRIVNQADHVRKAPMSRGAVRAPKPEGLFALKARCTLVEEGVHALAEILAHIGAQDQVLALVARQRPPDAAHRLLGDFKGDRRVAG